MEALLKLRGEDVARYDALVDTDTRTAVGFYTNAKRAAEAEGLDVSGKAA